MLTIDPTLTRILSCAPLLCLIEVQSIIFSLSESTAPKALQVLRSLPQSISWRPFTLFMYETETQRTVQELCAAFTSTPLAQAVSKLTLFYWRVEPPIAALRASFPNVLHFELRNCDQITALSFLEAVAAWPMLRSIILTTDDIQNAQESQKHLEALARMAAELKGGQPFVVVLQVHGIYVLGEGNAARMDVLVAAIHNAGGGKVDVRWMHGA